MTHLSLSCLGPFQVTLDGLPVTGFKSNKVRALLAYLAVEADRPHRREVLAALLWPDWPDRDALSNLRYALSDLRGVIADRTADPPFLLIERHMLQFNAASDYWLDTAAFTAVVEPALALAPSLRDLVALEDALALFRGGFLEGFSIGDSAAFEEWALLTRERLARLTTSALHLLAEGYERRGEYARAQSFARRQLEMDPWDESAHRQLIRLLALDGQRSAALAQYEICRRTLADELGVEPDAETTALYSRIRRDRIVRCVAPSPVPPELGTGLPPFLEGAPPPTESPVFVARERELTVLGTHLDAARAGRGRVVFVTGEAGSGKTALIQEFAREALAAYPDLVVAGGQGNAQTGAGDPYHPFRELMSMLTGDAQALWALGALAPEHARRLWRLLPLAVQALVRIGPDLIDLFVSGWPLLERARAVRPWPGELVPLDRLEQLVMREPDFSVSPQIQQTALFEQYTQVLRTLATSHPLLLVADDLQWADRGSLNLLFHLGRRLAGSRILIVGAYRPSDLTLRLPAAPHFARGADGWIETHEQDPFAPSRHPLEPIIHEFKRAFGEIEVDLERVDGLPFVHAFLDSEPNRLGSAFREALYRRTQGHALFTVELLRGMQDRGELSQDPQGRWVEGPALNWELMPARVEAVVEERIGRLPHSLQALLRVAAVEGETFTTQIVSAVLGVDEGEAIRNLSDTLDRKHHLVRARGTVQAGPRRLYQYRFRHILYQRYLYSTLDDVERTHLHEEVGTALERLYAGEQDAAVAVQLARHYEEAGVSDRAVHYLQQAGERALRLSAYQEALLHLSHGLDLLASLPESAERARQELDLRLTRGAALIAIGRFTADAGTDHARTRDLGRELGQTAELCEALGEMAVYHYVRAEHRSAREVAAESLSLAEQIGDSLLVAWGQWHLGFVLFGLGEFEVARESLEQVVASAAGGELRSFPRLSGADARLSAQAYLACTLWCLGYPDQALAQGEESVALARELGDLFTLGDVLCYGGCVLSAMRQDARALQQYADEMKPVAARIPTWAPPAAWHRAQALAMSGEVDAGIASMRASIAIQQSADKQCDVARALGAVGEAEAKAGRVDEGLAAINEALRLVEETGERYYEAELCRLRAELLLGLDRKAGAEAGLHCAIEVARRQSAKSWELRATTRLARLWKEQGRRDDARRMLTEIYNWFTEGFDTPDLQQAKVLLNELA